LGHTSSAVEESVYRNYHRQCGAREYAIKTISYVTMAGATAEGKSRPQHTLIQGEGQFERFDAQRLFPACPSPFNPSNFAPWNF
jgi:hypothetical protein